MRTCYIKTSLWKCLLVESCFLIQKKDVSVKKILTNIDSFYGSQRENEEHREHYILSINEKGLCYYLL
jgi:hypothetical protein